MHGSFMRLNYKLALALSLLMASVGSYAADDFEHLSATSVLKYLSIDKVSAARAQSVQADGKAGSHVEFYGETRARAAFEELEKTNPIFASSRIFLKFYKYWQFLNRTAAVFTYAQNGFWLAADMQMAHAAKIMHGIEKNLKKHNVPDEEITDLFRVMLQNAYAMHAKDEKHIKPQQYGRLENYLFHLQGQVRSGDNGLYDRMMRKEGSAWNQLSLFMNGAGAVFVPLTLISGLSGKYMNLSYSDLDYIAQVTMFVGGALLSIVSGYCTAKYFDAPGLISKPMSASSCTVTALSTCTSMLTKRGTGP